MPSARAILHLDMDAFFAAVEQRDHPHLRGKPLLVGYDGPRGVVATASYEARPFGCHSAQPIAVAKRLCPHAIIVPVRHHRYREVSDQVFTILDQFSPVIEPVSIDEAFLDLTGTDHLFGTPQSAAKTMKDRIRKELNLTASVGIAPNKFLAKLASDLDKPDGLTLIRPQDIDTLLPPMPVTKIWGIGPAMATRLKLLNITTIAHLRQFPLDLLRSQIGDEADHYHRLAHGLDDRPVVPERQAKSIGHEQTFDTDQPNPDAVRKILLEQTEQVARRLRRHNILARTLTLKIRYGNFQTITRSTTLPTSTNATLELCNAATILFDRWSTTAFQPVRLIGITTSQFVTQDNEPTLFPNPDDDKQKKIDAATDAITQKFGKRASTAAAHFKT